jgi:hypothetical protein
MPYSKERHIDKIRRSIPDRELGNMNMTRWLGTAFIVALLSFSLGCSGSPVASPTPGDGQSTDSESASHTEAEEESSGVVSVPAAARETTETATANAETEDGNAKNNISVASQQPETFDPDVPEDLYMNEDDKQTMTAEQEARQEFNRRNYDVTGAFDATMPTLMGIAIGTEAAVVKQRFGEPTDTFELPDESVEASVNAYPGFTIGIRNGKVLFVEVSTRSVSPGLNGLRLGDTREAALEKLGQPTADSEFIVSYAGNGAILKLDLNPETNQIHSIKLFPEE